jgi:hypothetical protein
LFNAKLITDDPLQPARQWCESQVIVQWIWGNILIIHKSS